MYLSDNTDTDYLILKNLGPVSISRLASINKYYHQWINNLPLVKEMKETFERSQYCYCIDFCTYYYKNFLYGVTYNVKLDLNYKHRNFNTRDYYNYMINWMTKACAKNKLIVLRWLFDKLQIDAITNLIRIATSKGYLNILKYLCEIGGDLSADDCFALKISSANGDMEMVKYCVESGLDIHVSDDYPLRWSVMNGHLEIVKYLCERGANIHAMFDEAINVSAENGYLLIVQQLINYGADIHNNNELALMRATKAGRYQIVKLLHECGANIHINEETMLSCAIVNNHIDIVNYYLDNGCDPNVRSCQSLKEAIATNHIEMVKIVMTKCSYVNINNATDAQIKFSVKKNHLDMVKFLLRFNSCLNEVNIDKNILNIAVMNSTIEMIKLLLSHGADITINDGIIIANCAGCGYLDKLKYLLSVISKNSDDSMVNVGCNANKKWYYVDMAMLRAAKSYRYDVVKYLIGYGASIHVNHSEVLMLSVKHNNLSMVQYLIEKGANIHAGKDDIMLKCEHHDSAPMVRYLLSVGANLLGLSPKKIEKYLEFCNDM